MEKHYFGIAKKIVSGILNTLNSQEFHNCFAKAQMCSTNYFVWNKNIPCTQGYYQKKKEREREAKANRKLKTKKQKTVGKKCEPRRMGQSCSWRMGTGEWRMGESLHPSLSPPVAPSLFVFFVWVQCGMRLHSPKSCDWNQTGRKTKEIPSKAARKEMHLNLRIMCGLITNFYIFYKGLHHLFFRKIFKK